MGDLGKLAWDNFCKLPGRTNYLKGGAFEVYVTIDNSCIGECFPLSVSDNQIPGNTYEDNMPGWQIPDSRAVIGMYLGMIKTHREQKVLEMTFATPTIRGKYTLYIADRGIVSWYGDCGDDEPAMQSGIKVDAMFITNEENTRGIYNRFRAQLENLGSIVPNSPSQRQPIQVSL